MKKQFNYGDGIITVDTTNGKTTVSVTDADGESVTLDEYNPAGEITEAQKEAISRRFGEANGNGQPF